MADPQHLARITEGVTAWNAWKTENPGVKPDLQGAVLAGADLRFADLSWTDLRGAVLIEANLSGANLTYVQLNAANLSSVALSGADLNGADLTNANLSLVTMVGTSFGNANLSGARVYGISVWDVKAQDAIQNSLIITPSDQPDITVDHLEVAQFIYLLLNNSRIRGVLNTITSKAVLILGRFSADRKATLEALRAGLRARNYLPIIFDFEKPTTRDFTETVLTLAGLARFVIADLTDPRSIPQELMAIIPQLPSVPIRPLLLGNQIEWAMFRDLARRNQVIPPFHYSDDAMLLSHLEDQVIEPAERRALEVAGI